jgi:hypothetical protein
MGGRWNVTARSLGSGVETVHQDLHSQRMSHALEAGIGFHVNKMSHPFGRYRTVSTPVDS